MKTCAILVACWMVGSVLARENKAMAQDSTAKDADESVTEKDKSIHGRTIVWGRERDGLVAGAYLLSSTNRLEPGDPIVIQFVLRNSSKEEKTVVVNAIEHTQPVLGEDNRIELNVLGGSQQRRQHVLKPEQVLRYRDYRVVVSTEGLPPGKYNVTAGVAFWMTVESNPNMGSGLSLGRPIEVALGEEESWPVPDSSKAFAPTDGIHWGKPVGGIIVGMKLRDADGPLATDSTVTGDLFAKNVTNAPTEFRYEIPGPTDWNMHVSTGGASVQLDSVWYSGTRPQVTREVTLAAGEMTQLTGMQHTVCIGTFDKGETSKTQIVESPAIRVLAAKTEFKFGDLPRLITTSGKYEWTAHVTIRRPTLRDLTMVVGNNPVSFEIANSPDTDKSD